MISKELLSKVLSVDAYETRYIEQLNPNEVIYYIKGKKIHRTINIHELAHKCKEWARTRGYILVHFQTLNSGYCCEVFELNPTEESENEDGYIAEYYDNFGKGNSIFQACQWILEQ